jgi:uncharacterized repeat protein (TIGR01451 family)
VFDPATGTVRFALGTLAANDNLPGGSDEGSVTITALVNATGGTLTDTAAISTTTPESDVTNNTGSVTNTAVSADVTVSKAGPAGPVLTGTVITYTLSYRNLGTAAAQTTQLVDALPAGLSFLSATGGGAFDLLTGTVTFALGTLAANDGLPGGPDEGSVTVTALVTATGGTITNTAAISTPTTESDATNNTNSVTTAVVSADVTVSKSGPAGSVLTGTVITYTLNYRNLGTAAAQGVVVLDTLPAGLGFVSATGGGTFDPIAGVVASNVGNLAANDGAPGGLDEGSATITALVTATGGTLTNTAAVSTVTPESDLTNNASSVTNTAVSADVTVSKTGPASPVLTGTSVTYTLSYANLGTAAAQATRLVDTLPAGLSFVSASGGTFNPHTGAVTFELGILAASDGSAGGPDEGSVTITALVTATGGTISNAAVISTATPESDVTNNSSSFSDQVIAADVAINKTGPAGPVLTGTTITYTLSYQNLGTAAARGVAVVDALPAGLNFVSASGGTFDPATDTVPFAVGTLAADDGAPGGPDQGSVTVTARVAARARAGEPFRPAKFAHRQGANPHTSDRRGRNGSGVDLPSNPLEERLEGARGASTGGAPT